ncbi:MAG: class I SAM-dependent methyltransferase [Saprospiraceae bacterium]|nr:class I SAM-dependent methyltransferase [Saprospiraceae bacterium]
MKKYLSRFSSWRWQLAQWAEWRWWRWYLKHKHPEEYLLAKSAYWNRFLDQCGVWLPPGAAVLDAGCGPAGIFIACPDQQVTAVDPLLPLYAQHLTHFRPEAYPKVHFIASPLENLELQPDFQWVFCLNAINHTRDPHRALESMCAAMQPGATLVLSTDTHKYPVLQWIFQVLPGDILHPQQLHRRDYEQLLHRNGLNIHSVFVAKKGLIFDYTVFIAGLD